MTREDLASMLAMLAGNKKPGAADNGPGTAQEVRLPCSPIFTEATLAQLRCADPMRDRRHQRSRAWAEIEAWLTDLELGNKSARTLYSYERSTAPLLRANPGKLLADITPADIKTQLALVPPRSRYISRSIYNQLFEWAVFEDRVDKNPMAKVQKMKAGPKRPKHGFSEEEMALLEALPVPNGPLFTILFYTGLRGAEARNLQRSHIDLNRGRLMVYGGKGHGGQGKDRIVPFKIEVATAVADLDLLESLQPGDYVWHRRMYPVGHGARRSRPIASTTFDRWYREQVRAAGISEERLKVLNPHQTRHAYAWWLEDNDFNLEERQELLGHDSPETTKRQYGSTNTEKLARKMAVL